MTEQERQEQDRALAERSRRLTERLERVEREMRAEANRYGGRTFDRYGEPCDVLWDDDRHW